GCEARFELNGECLATDVGRVLLEGLRNAVRGCVTNADAVRNVESGPFSSILDQPNDGSGLTFGHQLGTERRVEHDQHSMVGGGGQTRRWLGRKRRLVRLE